MLLLPWQQVYLHTWTDTSTEYGDLGQQCCVNVGVDVTASQCLYFYGCTEYGVCSGMAYIVFCWFVYTTHTATKYVAVYVYKQTSDHYQRSS